MSYTQVKWIKIAIDIFDHPKIRHIRRQPNGDQIILFWIMLLTMAGRCNAGGQIHITPNKAYTNADLAVELGFDEELVDQALELFQELAMIDTKKQFILIAGWNEYQSTDRLAKIREADRERKRKKRAEVKGPDNEGGDARGVSAESPAADEDEDEDEDEDQDYPSFVHSAAEPSVFTPEQRRTYLSGLGEGVVLISEAQLNDLVERLGDQELEYYIQIVAKNEKNGHHYTRRTHYQAILDMARKDHRLQSDT